MLRSIANSRLGTKKVLLVFISLLLVLVLFGVTLSSNVRASSAARSRAVSEMVNMADIPWVANYPSSPFVYNAYPPKYIYSNQWSYRGIPYSQAYNTDLATFKSKLSNGKLGSTSVGNDCSTAVVFAWQAAGSGVPNAASLYTKTMVDAAIANNGAIIRVGSWTAYSGNDSQTITLTNGFNKMKAAYQALQAGDGLVKHFAAGQHALLVTSITSTGVNVIDNGVASLSTGSSWRRAFVTYEALYNECYIPMTTRTLAY